MNDDFLYEVMSATLGGMADRPLPLARALAFQSEQRGIRRGVSEKDLSKRIADAGDPINDVLLQRLASWDHATTGSWIGASEPNTPERRELIYDSLQIGNALRTAIDRSVPFYEIGSPILVQDPHASGHWYSPAFRAQHDFYWGNFRRYLAEKRAWNRGALASLDASTTTVLERLDDPRAKAVRRTRGLIVGYVQSGKTSHFTGVIAKAIDAGYRLIVVLSGMTDLLRNQTQRRLDMELVGRENIQRARSEKAIEQDYVDDRDWESFISYGTRPHAKGKPEIVRLTGAVDDFSSLAHGITALEFEKREKRTPLNTSENLAHANARLVVVKKHSSRLASLLRDLQSISESSLLEVPALVIDDESDQASVNTLAPPRPEHEPDRKERTTINERIVELLKMLPRAQYLGYTATPFANVFINPNDPSDLYPRHFILSLPRPEGYMGASDFHDFAGSPAPGKLTNEVAYVRSVPNPDKKATDREREREALDAFLLSGALKLYRKQKKAEGSFRHHTMLVHESRLNTDQRARAKSLRKLWENAAYHSSAGVARLSKLFEDDFRRVSSERGDGLPFPKRFEELRPFVGQALALIEGGSSDGPILVVNGERDADTPDFDTTPNVWKIIVGGAKLSRGYTVEGLTVSYFRRRAAAQDTLMQMGRWFGFREGYRDLVRLFIGRQEPNGKKTLDLYDAFGAICRDEEDFRAQLERYSEPGPEGVPLTPLQVPAMVFNSHPQLRPTARNKSFNAKLRWLDFSGSWREPTLRSPTKKSREHNAKLVADLLAGGIQRTRARTLEGKGAGFDLLWVKVSNDSLVETLEAFDWPKGKSPLSAELEYLKLHGSEVIQEWIVLLPQRADVSSYGTWKDAGGVSTFARTMISVDRFKVFSESRHVDFAEWLVCKPGAHQFTSAGLKPSKGRGVMLLYPTFDSGANVTAEKKQKPVMGFALLLPARESGHGARTGFTVSVSSNPQAVTVPESDGGDAGRSSGRRAPARRKETQASTRGARQPKKKQAVRRSRNPPR